MKEKNIYKKLPPFKWFVLQNFPFIEEDFDAITNYQLLCKVVEYLNLNIYKTNELGEQVEALTNWFDTLDVQEEVNKKLDKMAEDGTLARIINQEIFDGLNQEIQDFEEQTNQNLEEIDKKMPLSQLIDTSIFGQIIPDDLDTSNLAFQSFAIGNNILVTCLNNRNDDYNGHLVSYNFLTGKFIKYVGGLSLGHANDITYCSKDGYFYVACMNLNKIAVFDENLNFIKNIDYSNMTFGNPYAIAYNETNDTFYVLLEGNLLAEMNYDLDTIINSDNLVSQNINNYTQQSIFFDGSYIYNVINLPNINDQYFPFNKLDVYNLDLSYYCSQKITIQGEIEAGFVYNNQLYFMRYAQDMGVLFKGIQKQNQNSYDYVNSNLLYNNHFAFTGNDRNYYVDTTYTDLFVDGSGNHPFNNLYIAFSCIDDTPSFVNVYLKGDFSNKNIALRHFKSQISFIGNSNDNVELGGVYLANCKRVNLRNLKIVKASDIENNLVTIRNCDYVYLNNIIFEGQATENKALAVYSSNVNVTNAKFNSDVVDNELIYATENSGLFLLAPITLSANGKAQFNTNNVMLPYQPSNKLLQSATAWKTTAIGGGITFNLKDITTEGYYRIEEGNTCSDAPEGLTTSPFRFKVENINDVRIYTVVPHNQNKLYKGVISRNQNSITWATLI